MILKGDEPKIPHAIPPHIAVRRPAIGVEPLAIPSPIDRARETRATRLAPFRLVLTASYNEMCPMAVRNCR